MLKKEIVRQLAEKLDTLKTNKDEVDKLKVFIANDYLESRYRVAFREEKHENYLRTLTLIFNEIMEPVEVLRNKLPPAETHNIQKLVKAYLILQYNRCYFNIDPSCDADQQLTAG